MKASTVEILDRINRGFYRKQASDFSRTRERPWPGWSRLFELARRQLVDTLDPSRIAILDLGCGNGRLLPELGRFLEGQFSYLGVDVSIPLLVDAASALGSLERVSFLAADLVENPLAELLPEPHFDLVVAFGLLHHVPSFERRQALLAAAADRVGPHGLMAVSFWQFGELERFRRRFVPWDRLPAGSGRLDTGDLETGDHLLAWGEAGAARYCHNTSPAEAEELIHTAGLRSLTSFRADGKSQDLNLYHLMTRTA